MTGNPDPREAFTGLSGHYERHRPDYPTEIIDWIINRLGLIPGDLVADVGAGTGILTRHLVAAGMRTIAVDISHEMLGRLPADRPGGQPLRALGFADALPLRVGAVQGIFAAQAFHWFASEVTLREWHRTLSESGGVALLWNNRDREQSEFVFECEALIAHHNPEHRLGYRDLPVEDLLACGGLFADVETRTVEHTTDTTPEGLLGFFRSVSYIAKVLSPPAMEQFESQLTALMARHFPSGQVSVPLRCRATVARRLDDPR